MKLHKINKLSIVITMATKPKMQGAQEDIAIKFTKRGDEETKVEVRRGAEGRRVAGGVVSLVSHKQ